MTLASGWGRAVSFAVAMLAFAMSLVAFVVFLAIAIMVLTGLTQAFDASLLLALRSPANVAQPLGPAWLQATARDFTALGSNGVLIALTLAGSVLLALARRRAAAVFLLASFWGALVTESAAKYVTHRPRPELAPHAARVFSTSFPSGHATVSAAVGFALTVLFARSQPGRQSGILPGIMAAAFVAVIGVSRVYLGVHWPTDILAGWALGAGWAVLCWAMLIQHS